MGCTASTTVEPPKRKPEPEKKSAAGKDKQSPPQPAAVKDKQSSKTTEPSSKAEILNQFRRYVALEKEIREIEGKNVVGKYDVKKSQLDGMKVTVDQMEQFYKIACEKVNKEQADVDNLNEVAVKNIMDKTSLDEKMSKEQEELLEAANEQEVAFKQLEGIKFQAEALATDVKTLEEEVQKLQTLYGEQDDLLADMFNGEYGSERENYLEKIVDNQEDRMRRIQAAHYKWTNAQVLLQHACNQMAFAVRRWSEVANVKNNDAAGQKMKYDLVTECRNNLIASTQNIENAQRYLTNIKFPYCDQTEMETLKRATCNIYVDMISDDRHEHALQCYSTTYKRAAALLQWFDSVINDTITRDLESIRKDLGQQRSELRNERLKLIKTMVGSEAEGLSEEDLQATDSNTDLNVKTVINKPAAVSGAETASLDVNQGDMRPPTPMALSELAPVPTQGELFGNIDELKKQHEQEMEDFAKAQETNKARMEQGLQEKLQARRSRRMRVESQETQGV